MVREAALRPRAPNVLTSYRELETVESTPANVSVHRIIDNWTLMHGRASLERANRIIEREGIDVLHVLFPDSVISHEYELPALIGFNRVPLVTTFWNIGLGRKSPGRTRLESLM